MISVSNCYVKNIFKLPTKNTDSSGGHFKNGRQSSHTTRVNISASNPPKIEILLYKYTFSGVLIKNKVLLNTLIQQNNKHFTDSSGGHFTK